MPTTRGLALLAGFQREATVSATTWPGESAAALAALLPLLDLQAHDGIQKVGHRSVLSGVGPQTYDMLHVAPTVTLTLKMRYQGFEHLWACALGHEAGRIGGTLMPALLATGVYQHLYELDAHLSTAEGWKAGDGWLSGDGLVSGQRKVRRGTCAINIQTAIWEYLSAMVQAVTLQATEAGVILEIELLAHSLSRTSSINTATTMASLPPPMAPGLLLPDLAVRVAPYSASTPLGSGDIVSVSSLTLRLENALSTTYGPRTGTAPEEFERSETPLVTMTLVFPRHQADIWQTRWSANTRVMVDAKWTGPLITGTATPYQSNVYVPSAHLMNAQLATAGPAVPPDTVQMIAVIPTAAAAGFPAMATLTPLAVELVNGNSIHSLI